MKTLSILICSIKGRERALKRLLDILLTGKWEHVRENKYRYLIDRYENEEVEIIVCTDAKQMTIGEKRNVLTKLATGTYVSEIDDDDTVEPDYISQILAKTITHPDCIVFDAFRFENGRPDRLVKYGMEYKEDSNTSQCYYRIPNHLMVFKRELALQVPYKLINFGEDAIFAKHILPLIKTQERIEKVLYHYLFTNISTSGKPTRR